MEYIGKMFLRDIRGSLVQVGDTIAYATNFSNYNKRAALGIGVVTKINWFPHCPTGSYPHISVRLGFHTRKRSAGKSITLTRSTDKFVKVSNA